jgi:hypothetical protein
MRYNLEFDTKADADLKEHIAAGSKIIVKRIYRILDELREHPEWGISVN